MTLKMNPTTLGDHKILIETGTFQGDFVESVLHEYDHIHTIEILKPLWEKAVDKFKDDDNVTCYLGDSSDKLGEILEDIDEPVIFWLDGHTAPVSPILKELEIIKNHHIKTHTIMVDDVRQFEKYGTSKEEVRSAPEAINPDYTIEYVNGFIPDDVIVARIISE